MKKNLVWLKLYVLFLIGMAVSFVHTAYLASQYHKFEKGSQKAQIVEAADRWVAADRFGCSGRWTISVECARSKNPKLHWLRKDLGFLDDRHCQQSADDEFEVLGTLKDDFWEEDQ